MAAFLDNCRFNPTLGGTTDWTVSSNVASYQTPAAAGAVNGRLYKYFAIDGSNNWELGEGAYNTTGPVLARTTITANSLGTTAKINFAAAPQVAIVAIKADLIASDEIGLACGMSGGQLVASAAAGALTVAVKTVAGNDPSALNPVFFYFRDSTLTAGDVVRVAVTAALSVVLGSTKTLGATNATGLRVWIAAFNNAGTVQLGAINCSDANGFFCPQEHSKYTTAVPASASKTWYSTAAIATAAPWRFLGFCEWNSLATAGTWVAPDLVNLFGPGSKKPGDVIQTARGTTSTSTTTTSTTYVATNLNATLTPTSAANLIRYSATAITDNSIQANSADAQMFRGSTGIGPVSRGYSQTGGETIALVGVLGLDLPNTTASTTYGVRVKSAGTSITFVSGLAAEILVDEVMG